MSTGAALAATMAGAACALLVALAIGLLVIRVKGRAPRMLEALLILIAAAVVMLTVMSVMWPADAAAPMVTPPATYGPPLDPMSGVPL
jgi:high-affinity Fe2+/Pb2+ permease